MSLAERRAVIKAQLDKAKRAHRSTRVLQREYEILTAGILADQMRSKRDVNKGLPAEAWLPCYLARPQRTVRKLDDFRCCDASHQKAPRSLPDWFRTVSATQLAPTSRKAVRRALKPACRAIYPNTCSVAGLRACGMGPSHSGLDKARSAFRRLPKSPSRF